METLKTDISKSLRARHVFYVMDACYGGLMADKRATNQDTQRTLKALQQIAKDDVRQVLTAGSKGEQVLDGTNGHSVFTYRLIEALESAGDFITANEIQAIITRNVAIDAGKFDHKQTPQYGKLYGQGDFVFVPSNDYKLAEKQAKIDLDRKQLEQQRLDYEKRQKQIDDDEATIQAAQKAGDERKKAAVELELRKKQALQRIAETKQKEKEEQLRFDEQAALELKSREAERGRIEEEAKRQQARLQEEARRKETEDARLEQQQQKEMAEAERKNADQRRVGEEKRKKALEAFTANSSIEAAVEDIRKADAEIAGINRDFDADLARQKAAAEKRMSEKKGRHKAEYDKRILQMKVQPAIEVAKPVIAPRDEEFETLAEYNARAGRPEADYRQRLAEANAVGENARQAEKDLYEKGVAKAEADCRNEIEGVERRLAKVREEAITPFRERIVTIAAKEYPVSPQSLKLTVGKYDPDKESFPVSVSCSSTAVSLSVEGKLPLPRDKAKLFKQQYTNGLLRADVVMKTGSSAPVRVAMVNDGVTSDADGYLLELYGGEFVTVGEKRRRELASDGEMVDVKGGCFQMGDTFGDGGSDEKPVHEVCLSRFRIGKYEVTQGQWQKIMGNNPSHFSSCGDDCPVEQVSWDDVQLFIERLNSRTGRRFRLPTEAEWEYAARSGGKAEKYSGSDKPDAVAWYSGNSGSKTHPVGQKQPNKLGIYDMSGNVWEWVSDWYGGYSGSRQQDPVGASLGSNRVFRGGSWYSGVGYARASYRTFDYQTYSLNNIGFRLAL
jgi:formylglycine-generating enzyme required for sulfatase activity